MAWMITEDKLDVYQREFINVEVKKKGSIWVKGFAGSGKSVLLVHHARSVLLKQPTARIGIVVYTKALVDLFETSLAELGLAGKVAVMTPYDFIKKNAKYDYLLCDEVQDLPHRVLHALRNGAGQVIVAGDSNQSIYEKDARWKEPVVSSDEIGEILQARPFMLKIVHRLTRSIIKAVNSLIPSMNIWATANDPDKQDIQIRVCNANSIGSEISYVWKEAQKRPQVTGGAETSAILLATHESILEFFNLLLKVNFKQPWICKENRYGNTNYQSLNDHLKQQGLSIQFIGNGYGSLQNAVANQHVIVMTYHSAKGLDFDDVFLPFMQKSNKMQREKGEILFMVAMTRSRRNLYITHTNSRHEYVERFANLDACISIDIDNHLNPINSSEIDLGF